MSRAYQPFDPYEFLRHKRGQGPANPANPANLVPVRSPALAGLAGLAGTNRSLPPEWRDAVARIQSRAQPQGIPADRWRQIVADADRFLAAWGGTAAALGWSTLDLFGVHQQKPMARYDAAGLMVLLDGAEVVAMTAEEAEIRTRSGARQRHRRTLQPKPEAVMLWDLP